MALPSCNYPFLLSIFFKDFLNEYWIAPLRCNYLFLLSRFFKDLLFEYWIALLRSIVLHFPVLDFCAMATECQLVILIGAIALVTFSGNKNKKKKNSRKKKKKKKKKS